MKVIIDNKKDLYKKLSEQYVQIIQKNPKGVLGLATGSSPEPLYKLLVDSYNNKEISFKEITTFNLDEYYGMDKNDKNSYYTFMKEHLFSKVDIDENKINFPPADEEGIKEYNQKMSDTPIDVQLLGIGSNGHIAFNEPGVDFSLKTRVVKLAEKTLKDNSRFFNSIDEVPTHAISMGIANIMESKKIILIAVGNNKAEAIKKIVEGNEITNEIPGTILKKHPDVTLYLDEEAASLLNDSK